jgi:hypothetical protein
MGSYGDPADAAVPPPPASGAHTAPLSPPSDAMPSPGRSSRGPRLKPPPRLPASVAQEAAHIAGAAEPDQRAALLGEDDMSGNQQQGTAQRKRRRHSAAPTAAALGHLLHGTSTLPRGRSCATPAGSLLIITLDGCLTRACWRGESGSGRCRHARPAHGSARSAARQTPAAAGAMQRFSGTGAQPILPSGCACPVVQGLDAGSGARCS